MEKLVTRETLHKTCGPQWAQQRKSSSLQFYFADQVHEIPNKRAKGYIKLFQLKQGGSGNNSGQYLHVTAFYSRWRFSF